MYTFRIRKSNIILRKGFINYDTDKIVNATQLKISKVDHYNNEFDLITSIQPNFYLLLEKSDGNKEEIVFLTSSVTNNQDHIVLDVSLFDETNGKYIYDEDLIHVNLILEPPTVGVNTLEGLTDVNIPAPTDGQVLTYNNGTSKWISTTIPVPDLSSRVAKAGDTMSGNLVMTAPALIQQNQPPAGNDDLTNKLYVDNLVGAVPTTLAGLDDVNIPAPTDGQVLTYDNGTSTWISTTIPEQLLPVVPSALSPDDTVEGKAVLANDAGLVTYHDSIFRVVPGSVGVIVSSVDYSNINTTYSPRVRFVPSGITGSPGSWVWLPSVGAGSVVQSGTEVVSSTVGVRTGLHCNPSSSNSNNSRLTINVGTPFLGTTGFTVAVVLQDIISLPGAAGGSRFFMMKDATPDDIDTSNNNYTEYAVLNGTGVINTTYKDFTPFPSGNSGNDPFVPSISTPFSVGSPVVCIVSYNGTPANTTTVGNLITSMYTTPGGGTPFATQVRVVAAGQINATNLRFSQENATLGSRTGNVKVGEIIGWDTELSSVQKDALADALLKEYLGIGGLPVSASRTVPPTINDDTLDGHLVGSRWYDVTNDNEYVCMDPTSGSAVWKLTTREATDLSAYARRDNTDTGAIQLGSNGVGTTVNIATTLGNSFQAISTGLTNISSFNSNNLNLSTTGTGKINLIPSADPASTAEIDIDPTTYATKIETQDKAVPNKKYVDNKVDLRLASTTSTETFKYGANASPPTGTLCLVNTGVLVSAGSIPAGLVVATHLRISKTNLNGSPCDRITLYPIGSRHIIRKFRSKSTDGAEGLIFMEQIGAVTDGGTYWQVPVTGVFSSSAVFDTIVSLTFGQQIPNTQNDLSDTTITAPSVGQYLSYNGAIWVNANRARIYGYMDFNTTSSGGTQNVYNWVQGTITTAGIANEFTLGANNTFTYTGTATKTFSVRFSGSPLAGSNDRTIYLIWIKNPTVLTTGAIVPPTMPTDYIPGSRATSTLRTAINDTDGIDGMFTVSLATNDTIRAYVSNVENNAIVTVSDWRFAIEEII